MYCWHVVWSNHDTQSGAGYMDMLLCNHGNCIGIWMCKDMEGKTKLMEKRPVVSTLRNMAVGAEEVFSILQRVTVMNTLALRLDLERSMGMNWSYKTDRDAGTITVKRVS